MEELKLKPCPFCGAYADVDDCQTRDFARIFWVECRGEDCGISGRIRHSREAAAAAWNRRATVSEDSIQ